VCADTKRSGWLQPEPQAAPQYDNERRMGTMCALQL
jgi:hypothetical protein